MAFISLIVTQNPENATKRAYSEIMLQQFCEIIRLSKIYIYIYISRERERERERKLLIRLASSYPGFEVKE